MSDNYTQKEKLGQVLEDFLYAILRSLFPAIDGFRILAPDKQNYNNHHGIDFRVFDHNKEVLAIECKNWRKMSSFKYGSDTAQTEVIERFHHIGTGLKLLLISFLEVFYNPALARIRANGIQIIETSKLVGHKDFRTQLFFKLKSVIQKLYLSSKKSPSRVSVQYGSDNSLVSKSQSNLNNYIPTRENTTKKAPIEDTKRFPERERFPIEPRFNH